MRRRRAGRVRARRAVGADRGTVTLAVTEAGWRQAVRLTVGAAIMRGFKVPDRIEPEQMVAILVLYGHFLNGETTQKAMDEQIQRILEGEAS